MISKIQAVVVGVAIATAGHACAAVTAEEAKQLDATLTPWGAEQAGNADGTIPAYTGMLKPPASYDPKKPGIRPDPFADEKPLYSVTAQNMDKYAHVLSEGLKVMLKKYPTFRVDVYPSHRTARYPAYVQENSIKNASACKTTNNGLQIEGCLGGMPFPIPKTGNEVMWNHVLRYASPSYGGVFRAFFIDGSGRAILQAEGMGWQEYPFFYSEQKTPPSGDSPYWMFRTDSTAPARKAGEKIVIVDHMDSLNVGRRAWQYLPGQRRVKLSPDLQYDTPNPQAGGAAVMDEALLFLGAQDRYDFKLIGKKEMLIPYNTFSILDQNVCPNEKRFSKNHVNPDCVRFELHRVWVVEANLKPGQRHIYPKRRFYFDEDMPGAGTADNYDASGTLYRVGFTYFTPWYETADQGNADLYTTHDLSAGTYVVGSDTAGTGYRVTERKPKRDFSADGMTGTGVR